MHIDLIDRHDDFTAIRDAWDAVYAADPEAQLFLSWAWVSACLQRLRTGWRVLAVKRAPGDAHYVAFMPLRVTAYMSRRHGLFCNEFSMPGLTLWADYTGFICAPDAEESAIPALAERLRAMQWTELELRHLMASERRMQLFTRVFDASTFTLVRRGPTPNADGVDNEVCPYVDLPADFEEYLQQLSANTRQKVRRYMRKVETSDELRITEAGPDTHARDIDILLQFWRHTWAEDKGSAIDARVRRFREILLTAFARGMLYLPMLWKGDAPLGGLASLVDPVKRALLFKVAGRDEDNRDIPAGIVLHGHSIRWAISQGLRTYDFLRGNEPYKYSYGAVDRRLANIVIRTRTRRNINPGLDPLSHPEVLARADEYGREGEWQKAATGYRQLLEAAPAGWLVVPPEPRTGD